VFINMRLLAQSGAAIAIRGALDAEDAAAGRNDLSVASPIEANLTARHDAGTAVVSGELSAELELVCSRCLRAVRTNAAYPIAERFTMRRDIAELDDDIHLVQEEIVELDPYLREAYAVQLPMAAVCSKDCKGLCPVCGGDRNTDLCGCIQEDIDPRLAGLKDFFRQ